MRRTLNRLASAKHPAVTGAPVAGVRASTQAGARYVPTATPTGLTGLTARSNPRPLLIYLYTATLAALRQMPESSMYRQSVERVTRHRLSVVEATKPQGWDEWRQRVQARVEHELKEQTEEKEAKRIAGEKEDEEERQLAAAFGHPEVESLDQLEIVDDGHHGFALAKKSGNPNIFKEIEEENKDIFYLNGRRSKVYKLGDRSFVVSSPGVNPYNDEEWDGRYMGRSLEGVQSEEVVEREMKKTLRLQRPQESEPLEEEPALTMEQVYDIEKKINSGLIEELVTTAEGELKLTSIMLQAKPWEELEEQPLPGQWEYFDRQP